MRVRNTAYMHDGTTHEFECDYGEQMSTAQGMGDVWFIETEQLGGDNHPDKDADCGSDSRSHTFAEHIEGEFPEDVMTCGEQKERRGIRDSMLCSDSMECDAVLFKRKRVVNLLDIVGKRHEVEFAKFLKHERLASHPLAVHVLESLREIPIFSAVIANAKQVPKQICGRFFHSSIAARVS